MPKFAVKFLMMWLLLGPTALCRAGVLSDCCKRDPKPQAHKGEPAKPSCCADHEDDDKIGNSGTESRPRKCGECADVCGTVFKPPGSIEVAVLTSDVTSIRSVAEQTPGFPIQCDDHSRRKPGLPYPPSDRPLLI